MSQGTQKRVVFIGIDGATWKLIEPMVAEGKLPNLARLVREGSSGVLESTTPINSSVAWSDFMTGTHAGKHGVFFFREQRHGSYVRPVISFHSIKAPTLWRLVSEHDKTVAVVTFPLTFPLEKLPNVAMVGGLLTPDRNSDFIYPPELRSAMEEAIGDLPSDNEPEKLFLTANLEAARDSLLHVTEQITRMGEFIVENAKPDLFALVFRGVDLASHQGWCFQDPEWAKDNPELAKRYGHLLSFMYELVDESLGRLLEKVKELDGQVSIGLCSDHGFGPITHRFFLNKWLVDNGYLVLKKKSGSGAKLKMLVQKKWIGLLRRTGLLTKLEAKGKIKLVGQEQVIQDMIDWSKTRAYSTFTGGEDIVLINLKGREPEGTVEPGAEYEQLRDEIIAGLKKVKTPEGETLITRIFKREELWAGPNLEQAPDIQFVPLDGSVNMAANPVHSCVIEPAVEGRPAMHRRDGIYIWHGEGVIKSGFRQDGPVIADMAPTILHLLGLPVEDYMDGKVMEGVLEDPYRAANPIQVREGHVDLQAEKSKQSAMSAEDEAKLVETMQALGYME
ncbi:MAG: hypothetical protein DWQ01_10915 [Planctomycetota bacterium]|nr:MAG: hypothetical protein DWQ01_10915 [Planctomycetota bacterium]